VIDSYADGLFLQMADGRRIGPFTHHWAAVAALIRLNEPDFRSLGGDAPEDLALEDMHND
jgi:hypothetical protein